MAFTSRSKPQILIAEDNPQLRVLMRAMIDNHWTTKIVNCGPSAIAAWKEGNFIAILMDIRMPSMDGYEVTRQIREEEKESGRRHVPIIAFTALATKEARLKCQEVGFDGFIAKPARMRDVIDTIYKSIP
jgi:CheY-like chemotaxis protein